MRNTAGGSKHRSALCKGIPALIALTWAERAVITLPPVVAAGLPSEARESSLVQTTWLTLCS